MIGRDDSYTHIIRNDHPEAGYSFIYAKNLCYNFYKKKYILFTKTNTPNIPVKVDVAFHYGWYIYTSHQSFDDMDAVIIEKESVITQPFTLHHIYHFIESLNFLWTKLLFVNDFPVVLVLFVS